MTDLLALALDAARAGGAATLGYYGQPLLHHIKADGSLLTQADVASHRVISERLTSARPDIPVLSEEAEPEAMAAREGWSRFWCVDPLDGTKEFIKATTGEFTVNIALVEGTEPVQGVVHVPVQGVTYFATDGQAWKQTGEEDPVAISTRTPSDDALTIVASRDHAGPEVAAFIRRAEADGWAVDASSMGSSLKFCLIAEGVADVYPRTAPTFEWDTAAAQAVVEAAGGGVSTRDGNRLHYNKDDLRNPSVFAWGEASLPWRRWADTT